MSHTFRVDAWAASFLASLGIAACGGSTDDGTSGSGGAGGAVGDASGGTSGADGGRDAAGARDAGRDAAGARDGALDAPGAVDSAADGTVAADSARDVMVAQDGGPVSCLRSSPAPGGGGFEVCADGTLHRPAAGACDVQADAGQICEGCACFATCVTDADCASALGGPAICLCSGTQPGRCVSAECTTDGDCPEGRLCAPYEPSCTDDCVRVAGFACQSPSDTCRSAADCGPDQLCTRSGGVRQCGGGICGIGRPFIVADFARVAPRATRADWCEGAEGACDLSAVVEDARRLDPAARARVASAWAEVGLLEHASVAAFARFTLELLAVGAPPELVAASQRAGLDEIEHARIAFALARALGGGSVGPGRLEVADALARRPLEVVVRTAILEGCVGEMLAAVEAELAAATAESPALAAVLRRIGRDEREHAALAWRFVAWAAGRLVSPEWVQACFRDAVRAEPPAAAEAGVDDPTRERWGHVGHSARARLRREVLALVVRPAAGAIAGAQESRAVAS